MICSFKSHLQDWTQRFDLLDFIMFMGGGCAGAVKREGRYPSDPVLKFSIHLITRLQIFKNVQTQIPAIVNI